MTDMEGQPLGPKHVRYYSLLDSTDKGDMFTAYCDRHTREMKDVQPPVKYDNAIYTVKDPFKVYTCPECLVEVASREGEPANNVFMAAHMSAFLSWDDGESPGDWFEYLCEYDDLNEDGALLQFTQPDE